MSSESPIFLEDCDEAEVCKIILELHNGKAIDILVYKIPFRRLHCSVFRPTARASNGILHTSDIPIIVSKAS